MTLVPQDDNCAGAPCPRQDMRRWTERGGPLPVRLSVHVVTCAACAAHVRRLNRIQASMTLLRGQAIPSGLAARANGRALRMLHRAARATAEARRALQLRPRLTAWQRAHLHVRCGVSAAAVAALVLAMRITALGGLERTQAAGETLASHHWDRHIDPNGEWISRDRLT